MRSRVVVALDVPGEAEALALVDRLGDVATFYKVGLELYTAAGPSVVRALRERHKRVFLDLKLHDIPNTVASAARAAAALGVDLLTVHAQGGGAMVRAAREGAGDATTVLAVTVLTSMTSAQAGLVWGKDVRSIADEVARLARMASEAGAGGVVASTFEAPAIRSAMPPGFLIVTPGIRPSGVASDDQRRVATPAEAVAAGADLLVIGRPVTRAPDPEAAMASVLAEMEGATSSDPGNRSGDRP